MTGAAGARDARPRSSGAVTRPCSPALPSSVVSVERDPEILKQIQTKQLLAPARPVEERGTHAARAKRLGEREERRQPDAARDHPRLGRWLDERKRTAERSQAGEALSGPALYTRAVDGPMRLFSSERPDGRTVPVAEDFEHGKWPPEQRVVPARPPSPSRTARAPPSGRSRVRAARARCSRPTAGDSSALRRRHRPASRQYTVRTALPPHRGSVSAIITFAL